MGANGEKESRCWVGFDLGGTKMLSLVFNSSLEVVGRERKKTKAEDGTGVDVDRITKTIKSAIDQAKVDKKEIGGIGLAVPGALDLDRGVVLNSPNLGWRDLKLKDMMQKEFVCPVVLLNDVDAGVYGEYCFGAGKNARCVVGVFPGTGVGGGAVYNGQIIRGSVSSCMEIGHIQLMPDGPLCGCGRRGCLEALSGRLAIASAAAAAAFRGEAPYLAKQVGTSVEDIRSGVLAEAIKEGDKAVEAIVRQAAYWLGVGVATTVDLLAPDVVVLGGGLVEAMPELFLKEVAKAARATVMPSYEDTFKVAVAKLGDDATAMGAAAWVRQVAGGAGGK